MPGFRNLDIYILIFTFPYGVFMETAELKGVIGELEARVVKIRDWL